MKITVDLSDIADEIDWQFYQALGEIIQRHLIELVQAGNLSLPLLGDIYKRISDRLIEDNPMGVPSGVELTEAVVSSFGGQIAGEVENGIVESTQSRASVEEKGYLDRWELMRELDQELSARKFNQIELTLESLLKKRPIEFEKVATCINSLSAPMLQIIDRVNQLQKSGRALVVISKNDWIMLAKDEELKFSRSVVEWRDVLRLRNLHSIFEEFLQQSFLDHCGIYIELVEKSFESLPIEAKNSMDIDFQTFRDATSQYDQFENWLKPALADGVFRVDIERKLNDEFPLLMELSEDELLNVEDIFANLRVIKTKRNGRVFFQQG